MPGKPANLSRCGWVGENNPAYEHYHDVEWGVPLFDEQRLFEMLILEGAQAGLSWITILKRRDAYRAAFCQFDVKRVAKMSDADLQKQLVNPGIIRNKLKVMGTRTNARAYLEIQREFGSFATYLWQFVNNKPVVGQWKTLTKVPASTDISVALSKDLKRRGMTFVGPTIMYAYMQAVGLVNDHVTSCFRYKELTK